jgi:transposase
MGDWLFEREFSPRRRKWTWTQEELQFLRDNYASAPRKLLEKKLGKPWYIIEYVAKKLGLQRKYRRPPRRWTKEDLELLRKLYLEEKLPVSEIAERFGVLYNRLYDILKRYGIPTRRSLWLKSRPSKEELEHLYIEKNMSLRELGIMFKVSPDTVKQWMKAYGIRKKYDWSYHQDKKAIHEKYVDKVIKDLTAKGFRCVRLSSGPIPDIIAVKNGKIYAVEVETGGQQHEFDKYVGVSWYDDIIWVLVKPWKGEVVWKHG